MGEVIEKVFPLLCFLLKLEIFLLYQREFVISFSRTEKQNLMKMLNLTLQQTMQPSAAFICNVNFLLNEFISTVKNTEKKDKK